MKALGRIVLTLLLCGFGVTLALFSLKTLAYTQNMNALALQLSLTISRIPMIGVMCLIVILLGIVLEQSSNETP